VLRRGGAETKRGEEETDSGSLLDGSEELLKRLTLPSGQRAEKWIEEEIDEGQDSGKAAKVGSKGKRLKPITEIDEEDLEDSELDINTVQVSLSIARPPKQKQHGLDRRYR